MTSKYNKYFLGHSTVLPFYSELSQPTVYILLCVVSGT